MPTRTFNVLKVCLLMVLVAASLWNNSATGQDAVLNSTLYAGRTMGLKECLSMAISHNKKIEIADLEVRIRQGELKTGRVAYLPVIKVDGSVIKYESDAVLRVDLSFLGTLLGDFKGFLSEDNREQIAAFQRDSQKIKVKESRITEGGMTIYQPGGAVIYPS